MFNRIYSYCLDFRLYAIAQIRIRNIYITFNLIEPGFLFIQNLETLMHIIKYCSTK